MAKHRRKHTKKRSHCHTDREKFLKFVGFLVVVVVVAHIFMG